MASSCHPRRIFLASLGGALLPAQPQPPELDLFFGAFSSEPKDSRAALTDLAKGWRNSYAIMLLEMLRIHLAYAGPTPSAQPDAAASDQESPDVNRAYQSARRASTGFRRVTRRAGR